MFKVEAKDLHKEPKEGHVRVKVLKFVGQFEPGDVVECDEEKAKHLCSKSKLNTGAGDQVMHVRAVLLSEAKEMEEKAVNLKDLSMDELREMGRKNIVVTPIDPIFEARLANLRKFDQGEIESADGETEPAKKFSKKGKNQQASDAG